MDQRYSGSRLVSAAESACAVITGGRVGIKAHLSQLLIRLCDAMRTWRVRAVAVCARQLTVVRREVHVLSLVAQDARTPWYAKLIAALAAGYSFSPLQLIPSFIPVLGLLDDLVILALGVRLALRLTPPAVLATSRARAAEVGVERGIGARKRIMLVVGVVWVMTAALGMLLSIVLLHHLS